MFQSEFISLTEPRIRDKKQILLHFYDTIVHIKKKEAFDKIRTESQRKKKKWKYKLFTKIEKTFFYLRREMPLAIEMWIFED